MMGTTHGRRQGHNGMAHTQFTVQNTRSREIFREASALYARVFGYTSVDHSLNPKLLSAIVANGGAAVAATTAENSLVGFAYGFVGFDGTRPYLYSQAAFIDPDYQSQGIGRLLKQAQRNIATDAGLTSMRWAFDPVLARNAHFNLDVLGARGVRFAPRYYDESFTDRLIVDWAFVPANFEQPVAIVNAERRDSVASVSTVSGSRAPGSIASVSTASGSAASVSTGDPAAGPSFSANDWGRPVTVGRDIHVPIPASITDVDPVLMDALRMTLAATFTELFAAGFAPVSCVRVDAATATYRFVPTSEAAQ
jgi:predicted GNAT superfamily acetyltransferase